MSIPSDMSNDATTVRDALAAGAMRTGATTHAYALAALDRLVAENERLTRELDEWRLAAGAEAHMADEFRAERDEAQAERDHWQESALADRTRTAEARVERLEAALRETYDLLDAGKPISALHALDAFLIRNGALAPPR